jgi:hypothetical protein
MTTKILIGALGILLGACQSGQNSPPLITLEEARQVALNLQKANYEPPDRSIDQILKSIQDLSNTEEKLREIGVIKESCPEKIDRFGQYTKRISNQRSGYDSEADMFLGERQKLFAEGYFSESLNVGLRGISALGSNQKGAIAVLHSHLALGQTLSGDITSSSDAKLAEAIRRLKSSKSTVGGTFWYQHDGDRVLYLHLTVLEGLRAHFQGKYPVAEVYFREALNFVLNESYGYEVEREHIYYWLTKNLVSQGRLLHAEYTARLGLTDRPKAALRSFLATNLVKILIDQGRFPDAHKLSKATLKYLDAICVPKRSYFYALTQFSFAVTLSLQGKIDESNSQLETISHDFGQEFPEIFSRQFSKVELLKFD